MMPGGGSGAGLMELHGDTPTGGMDIQLVVSFWQCGARLRVKEGIKLLMQNGIPVITPVKAKDIFVSINCKKQKVIIPTIDVVKISCCCVNPYFLRVYIHRSHHSKPSNLLFKKKLSRAGCITTGGPAAGQACVFPFTFHGVSEHRHSVQYSLEFWYNP